MLYNELKAILIENTMEQKPSIFQSVATQFGIDIEKPEIKALRRFLIRERTSLTFNSEKDLTFPEFMDNIAKHDGHLCDQIEDEAKATFESAKYHLLHPTENIGNANQHIFWNWIVKDILNSKNNLSLWADYLTAYLAKHGRYWENGENPMERIQRHNTPEYDVTPTMLAGVLRVDIYTPVGPKS